MSTPKLELAPVGPRRSILELTYELGNAEGFHEFLKYKASRYIATTLMMERISRDITYEEMADRIGWTPDEIQRFEEQTNDEVTTKDVAAYSKAVFAKESK